MTQFNLHSGLLKYMVEENSIFKMVYTYNLFNIPNYIISLN